jgi:hypothetical protein
MWSVFGSIISGFVLLRDLFGYIIPGALLLGIFRWSGVDTSILPISDNIWVRIAVVIAACYAISHVLAAIGYVLYDLYDRLMGRKAPSNTKDVVYYRYLYPSMFIEYDRRDTLTIMRVGLSMALIIGAWSLPARPFGFSLVLGLFMFWNAYLSRGKAAEYLDATLAAAKDAEQKPIPPFRWGAGGGNSKDGG